MQDKIVNDLNQSGIDMPIIIIEGITYDPFEAREDIIEKPNKEAKIDFIKNRNSLR